MAQPRALGLNKVLAEDTATGRNAQNASTPTVAYQLPIQLIELQEDLTDTLVIPNQGNHAYTVVDIGSNNIITNGVPCITWQNNAAGQVLRMQGSGLLLTGGTRDTDVTVTATGETASLGGFGGLTLTRTQVSRDGVSQSGSGSGSVFGLTVTANTTGASSFYQVTNPECSPSSVNWSGSGNYSWSVPAGSIYSASCGGTGYGGPYGSNLIAGPSGASGTCNLGGGGMEGICFALVISSSQGTSITYMNGTNNAITLTSASTGISTNVTIQPGESYTTSTFSGSNWTAVGNNITAYVDVVENQTGDTVQINGVTINDGDSHTFGDIFVNSETFAITGPTTTSFGPQTVSNGTLTEIGSSMVDIQRSTVNIASQSDSVTGVTTGTRVGYIEATVTTGGGTGSHTFGPSCSFQKSEYHCADMIAGGDFTVSGVQFNLSYFSSQPMEDPIRPVMSSSRPFSVTFPNGNTYNARYNDAQNNYRVTGGGPENVPNFASGWGLTGFGGSFNTPPAGPTFSFNVENASVSYRNPNNYPVVLTSGTSGVSDSLTLAAGQSSATFTGQPNTITVESLFINGSTNGTSGTFNLGGWTVAIAASGTFSQAISGGFIQPGNGVSVTLSAGQTLSWNGANGSRPRLNGSLQASSGSVSGPGSFQLNFQGNGNGGNYSVSSSGTAYEIQFTNNNSNSVTLNGASTGGALSYNSGQTRIVQAGGMSGNQTGVIAYSGQTFYDFTAINRNGVQVDVNGTAVPAATDTDTEINQVVIINDTDVTSAAFTVTLPASNADGHPLATGSVVFTGPNITNSANGTVTAGVDFSNFSGSYSRTA